MFCLSEQDLQPAFLTLCLSQPPTLPAFRSPSINAHIKEITFSGFECRNLTGADILARLSAFPRHATLTSLTFEDIQDLEDVLSLCAASPLKHRLVTVDTLSLEVCNCSPIWVMAHHYHVEQDTS